MKHEPMNRALNLMRRSVANHALIDEEKQLSGSCTYLQIPTLSQQQRLAFSTKSPPTRALAPPLGPLYKGGPRGGAMALTFDESKPALSHK